MVHQWYALPWALLLPHTNMYTVISHKYFFPYQTVYEAPIDVFSLLIDSQQIFKCTNPSFYSQFGIHSIPHFCDEFPGYQTLSKARYNLKMLALWIWKFWPKNDTFRKSIFSPMGGARATFRGSNESWDPMLLPGKTNSPICSVQGVWEGF